MELLPQLGMLRQRLHVGNAIYCPSILPEEEMLYRLGILKQECFCRADIVFLMLPKCFVGASRRWM